ncbi:helix-turn-helix domain-containing protein [Microbacterium immunditiarum]|uniref:Putative ArsR family transcriptional regulator n=1 Tax=Microbacterium immunditiarum TaxID=337480 RepID=A0A7Y9GMR3_9MICO|nr:helix-turn-helix domain-containing protein [Microbacterium immunditiarum]NYE19363.1 putative ArsR family transcriptional regulator [Microbacterium immunditiarum]
MPRRVDDYRGLAQASRIRLLDAIQSQPGILLSELASRTGLHENTVRDHVRVLEDRGLIVSRATPQGTRGRPPLGFHPVRDASANPVARSRIERAAEHGDLLRRLVPCVRELPAEALHQLDVLYEHLDDAGLEPEIDEASLIVRLRPCPFYPLMDDEDEKLVVCAVHQRLADEILHQVPGPLEISAYRPFVTPHECRIELRDTTAVATA